MESALPLLLFLAFLFGSMILILATGCASRMSEAFEEESLSPTPPSTAAGLFGARAAVGEPWSEVDPSALASVEHYLLREEHIADEFVVEPSPERLYLLSSLPPKPDDPFFTNVERFLATEQGQAEDFVANPSIESLYGHCGLRAVV